ncbi:MAG: 1-deoxy-D-xylulose-5-phosphate synthase [Alphaproteobacteria bacterium]|nr:1-deoxy-D-xylulose-5-phosphate synthase [Alphaproteobacteria bacterium]
MSAHKTRIMYIESKADGLSGPARIGRVTFSKSGKSLSYAGQTFGKLKGGGFKANYFDLETHEEFWISGPRKDGMDRLYPESSKPVEIDDDVAEEYWRDIRGG